MDFSRQIDAKIAANPNYLDSIKLFGYTMLNSLGVILDMSPAEYPSSSAPRPSAPSSSTRSSTGRSPMVVIRVAPIKPKLVVIQNVDMVDKLAVKIAQVERIPLLTTKLSGEELKLRLNNI